MEIIQWYAISLGALVVLFFMHRLFLVIISTARIFGTFFFLKHLIYPQIHKRLRGEGTITRLHSLIISLYLCGNILCVLFKTTGSTTQIGDRLALMSLVNLIPLCFSGRMNILANFCGMSYENHSRMHRWIGRVVVIQGLIHGAISLSQPKSKPGLPGLLAAGGMSLLLLLSFFFVRRLFYELFLKLHLFLAVATVVILWYHISGEVRIYLVVAISMLGIAFALRILLLLYRNCGGRLSRAAIQQLPDAIQVSLKVRGSWSVQAGQYIYLYAPGLSFFSWLQSHPFVLAWWHQDAYGDLTLIFLVQPRKGFTRKLQYAQSSIMAFIEGPYGSGRDLGSYGTVLMFATGIGIAGQLPYIKSLLNGYHNREVRTQRISLHWQLDKESHETWVKHWMDELLKQDDEHKILDISLYVPGEQHRPIRYGKRLSKFYKSFDVQHLVKRLVKEQSGRIIVSICTDSKTKDKVRKTVGELLTKNIRLVELDFYPAEQNSASPERDLWQLG